MIFFTVHELYTRSNIDQEFLEAFHSLNKTSKEMVLKKNQHLRDFFEQQNEVSKMNDTDNKNDTGNKMKRKSAWRPVWYSWQ